MEIKSPSTVWGEVLMKASFKNREKRVQIATRSWQRAGSDISLYSLKESDCVLPK